MPYTMPWHIPCHARPCHVPCHVPCHANLSRNCGQIAATTVSRPERVLPRFSHTVGILTMADTEGILLAMAHTNPPTPASWRRVGTTLIQQLVCLVGQCVSEFLNFSGHLYLLSLLSMWQLFTASDERWTRFNYNENVKRKNVKFIDPQAWSCFSIFFYACLTNALENILGPISLVFV